ncbi:hypothetical protein GCM10011512_04280 [Tersicoccus solisilvae]|uniref:Uncharacterized protein n=1 Tax=Tersicoccus solisilvae TaxID=1882339 RepID=A0ABQ1NMA1_9MICC|nr:hypothetical protein GCM10011512_04280 [Tersicoccus solisilvae]
MLARRGRDVHTPAEPDVTPHACGVVAGVTTPHGADDARDDGGSID